MGIANFSGFGVQRLLLPTLGGVRRPFSASKWQGCLARISIKTKHLLNTRLSNEKLLRTCAHCPLNEYRPSALYSIDTQFDSYAFHEKSTLNAAPLLRPSSQQQWRPFVPRRNCLLHLRNGLRMRMSRFRYSAFRKQKTLLSLPATKWNG